MRKYWFHYPSMVYAMTFYARNAQDARAYMRRWLGVSRLPNGYAIWE